ncbi:MAG: hypothetical protein EOL87_10390 [Spartobacteria bacterium]|nr:hypothetical protein [Spartobacteria bacterium]
MSDHLTDYQASCLDAILSHSNSKRAVVVDFDYTLILANSTDEFIRAARPGWLCCLICWLSDTYLRCTDITHYSVCRDYMRVKWLLCLMPWLLSRWKKTVVPAMVPQWTNMALCDALRPGMAYHMVVSNGFSEVIGPILNEMGIVSPLIASSINKKHNIRQGGKLQAIATEMPDFNLGEALAVTDSEDDRALLDAVASGWLVQWVKPQPYRLEDKYLPGHYIQHCRYAGKNYLKGQVALEDLPLVVVAFLSLTNPVVSVAACFLYLSLLIVYEMGYIENDRCAYYRADDTTRPALFHQFQKCPYGWGWIWSLVTGFLGLMILQDGTLPESFVGWSGILLLLRGVFWIHNHMVPRERYFTYLSLSLLRYGSLFFVIPAAVPGIILMLSQVLCQSANYMIYRSGGSVTRYRRQSFRLMAFCLLSCVTYMAAWSRFNLATGIQTILGAMVCCALIALKEPRTVASLLQWIRSKSFPAAISIGAYKPVTPMIDIGCIFRTEEECVKRVTGVDGLYTRVVIWGAGRNGRALFALLRSNSLFSVAYFVDSGLAGSVIDGLEVFEGVTTWENIDCVFIAMNAAEEIVTNIGNKCNAAGVQWIQVINANV